VASAGAPALDGHEHWRRQSACQCRSPSASDRFGRGRPALGVRHCRVVARDRWARPWGATVGADRRRRPACDRRERRDGRVRRCSSTGWRRIHPASAHPWCAQQTGVRPTYAQPLCVQPTGVRPTYAHPASVRPTGVRPASAQPTSPDDLHQPRCDRRDTHWPNESPTDDRGPSRQRRIDHRDIHRTCAQPMGPDDPRWPRCGRRDTCPTPDRPTGERGQRRILARRRRAARHHGDGRLRREGGRRPSGQDRATETDAAKSRLGAYRCRPRRRLHAAGARSDPTDGRRGRVSSWRDASSRRGRLRDGDRLVTMSAVHLRHAPDASP